MGELPGVPYVLVAIGGALGSVLRYAASTLFGARPLTTFAVNISGAFLIGLLASTTLDEKTRLAFGTGVLGGFTTFSAWQLEAVSAARAEAEPVQAFIILFGSLGVGFAALVGRVTLWASASDNRCDTDGLRRDLHFSPNLYQLGMAVGLLSISAFFIALILAYSFRIEASGSWQKFHVPDFLWLSTAVLAISSCLLESARYVLRRGRTGAYRRRLIGAIALGVIFLALQFRAGVNLFQQGVTTEANPHGSAFYIFMGIHAVHLIVGICWLEYLYIRSRRLFGATENDLRKHRAVAAVAATYWHFMGLLWAVLFFFLLRWSQ